MQEYRYPGSGRWEATTKSNTLYNCGSAIIYECLVLMLYINDFYIY